MIAGEKCKHSEETKIGESALNGAAAARRHFGSELGGQEIVPDQVGCIFKTK